MILVILNVWRGVGCILATILLGPVVDHKADKQLKSGQPEHSPVPLKFDRQRGALEHRPHQRTFPRCAPLTVFMSLSEYLQSRELAMYRAAVAWVD